MVGTVFWSWFCLSVCFFITLGEDNTNCVSIGRKQFWGKKKKVEQKGLGCGTRVTAHKVLSPPQLVADPPHGEGGDHTTDGKHGDGEGPVHGEDVRGAGRVLADVSRGHRRARSAAPGLRDGDGDIAVLPGGVGGVSVQGSDAQHTPIVGFYHLRWAKGKKAVGSNL